MKNKNLVQKILFHSRVRTTALIAGCLLCLPMGITATETLYEVGIKVSSDATLQQFQLPENLYLLKQNGNINPMKIVDKFGSELPFEISKYPTVINHEKRTLKLYPLTESRYLQAQTGSLFLDYDEKDRLREIHKSKNVIKSNQIIGYLIDQGKTHLYRNSQLTFSLSAVSETGFLKYNIDESSNLKNWKNVSRGEVLAQLVTNGDITFHNKINLKNIGGRYLRLTIINKNIPFTINSVVQNFTHETSEIIVWSEIKNMLFDKDEQGYLLDISPLVAYKKIQIQAPDAPSIMTADLLLRTSPLHRWSYSNQLNLINIADNNTQILDDEFPIWFAGANQIKLKVRYASPQLDQHSLKVKLAYRPQKITFFANGNEPYKLQISHAKNHNKQNINSQLFTSIKKQSGHSIGTAILGEMRTIEVDSIGRKTFHWGTVWLWMILVVGVIVMGWMARNLLKQID